MDQILKGIVASEHPEHVKKTLIQQLVSKSANELPEEQCKSIFEISSQWMAKENTAFLNESGKLILTSWGKHHKEAFQRFFTEEYLLSYVENSEEMSVGSVNYIRTAFELLQHTPQIFSLYTIVRHRANIWISLKSDNIDFCTSVCRLLIEYNHCWPVGDHLLQTCFSLLHCLGRTDLPKSSKQELKICIRNAGVVAAFMNRVLTKNQGYIIPFLTELFKIISCPGPNPSVAVASVVQFFTPEVIDSSTKMVAGSPSVSDEHLTLALTRMISWLSWPGGRRIDQWIICFLRALAMAKKHNILIQVTLEKLPQVFSRLLFPVVRDSTMGVLSHMLLSFKHSPQAFHLIVENVPDLVKALKKEDSASSKACLQTLAELMHLLMYQHSGFPELYGPVLDSLQDFTKPSEAMIKKWLAQAAWSAQAFNQTALSRITPKSETGRTGLVNLGNTCYMNSIIQALYMLDEFNGLLLSRNTTSALERVVYRLQELFVFLKMSQRAAFSPTKFYHVARPPWFMPGSQQDCSEFLKYLLDRIEEEDKALSNLSELKEKIPHMHMHSNIIEDTFEGKLLVCHRCRRCNCVSYCEEVFTDLPLAFPQNSTGVDRDFSKGVGKSSVNQSAENTDLPSSDRSLKGGDIGQRPSVPSISSNSKGEGESSSESGSSSPTSNYTLPKSSGSQSKVSSHGVGAEDPSISLEEMLGYFFEPEILEGSNQYHCEQCQSLQDAERSVVISKAPYFLVLTLKRFSYNVTTHQRSKILQSVTYPLKLKLSNNIIRMKEEEANHHPGDQSKGCSPVMEERHTPPIEKCLNDEKMEAPPTKCTKQDLECASDSGQSMPTDGASNVHIPLENFPSETMYALTSVVVHSGVSSESGHYYCYARPSNQVVQYDDLTVTEESNKASDGKDKKPVQSAATNSHSWCLFNDSRVSSARFETFSDITKRFPRDTPYVLIYKNISKHIGASHVIEASGSGVAMETKERKIRQDFVDAVNLDNLLYLQEIEHESRMFSKPKFTPTKSRDTDDDDENGPSNSGCGPGAGYSTPFNRFIF